jgi:DinB superfamily
LSAETDTPGRAPGVGTDWRPAVWAQFGAAIDALENAIGACPDELWGDRSRFHEYWYLVYHTLFFLDYNSSESVEGFAPPEPITLSELDPEGGPPERVYTKDEMRRYLEHGREKTRSRIAEMSDEKSSGPRRLGSRSQGSELELLLYNMRHVQHHTAQLNMILRLETDSAPGWVGKAKRPLRDEA